MAVFEAPRAVGQGHGITTGMVASFQGLFGSVIAWNDARVTRNALSKLSDRELDDIGLTRADLFSIR